LAKRDIPALTKLELKSKLGNECADLLILFGGTIPYCCDVSAEAFKKGLAQRRILLFSYKRHK